MCIWEIRTSINKLQWVNENILSQAEIKTAGRNVNNLIYADDTALIAENEEYLKKFLKTESEKAGLKLNIQITKIMTSGPITSWQTGGEEWKQWQILFSSAWKSLWMVTAVLKFKDTCSLEGKLWQT